MSLPVSSEENLLIWHGHKKAFCRKLVRLNLVVGRVYAGAACQQKKQFRGRVRVVGRFGDICLDIVELCDFLVTSQLLFMSSLLGGIMIVRQ